MVLRVIEMIGRFAKLAASFSLMLCVSVSAPAFSSSKHHDKANCPYAKARLEQAKVGNAICILTGRPNVASHSTCSVPRGEGYVELDVTGSVGALPTLTTVGALVQKAVSRL